MKLAHFISFSLLLCCCWFCSANVLDHRYQKAFRVQSLSLEDGLSQSVVNDIIQDEDGYMWIATEGGLNRFNGYSFEIFEQDHLNPNSLHDSLIYSLAEESGQGIWIGTQSGLSFFDPVSQIFTSYQDFHADLKTAIVALAALPTGKVFIGSENGLFVFDRHLNQINFFRSNENVTIEDEITSISIDGLKLWVSTESCLYSIETTSGAIESHCYGELGNWLSTRALKVVRKSGGELWLGSTNGLAKFNLSNKTLQTFESSQTNEAAISSNWIQDLEFDERGNLWIATNNGLNVYRVNEGRFTRFVSQTYDEDGLSSNDIMSVFIDKSGLIWLGTYAAGVNLLDPFQTRFKHIISKSDLVSFNAHNTIHGIAKDKDEFLWLANYGAGVFRLDLMTGDLTRPFYQEIRNLSGGYNYPYSLLIDAENRLWVGTTEGIVIINLDTQQVSGIEYLKNGQPLKLTDYIFQIYEDHSNRIWIATLSGLYQVENIIFKDAHFELSLRDVQIELPFSFRDRSSRVSAILETKDGNLWVGGPSGLLMYSSSQKKWVHFEYHKDNQRSLSHDDVQVLFEDSRGILWIGTANGLNKVVRSSDDDVYFERITKRQGLPNNNIYGILEDNYKQLWISTNLGLVKYSAHTDAMQNFRNNDGLSSDEFNSGAYFSDSEGLLYFGSINGVTVVDSQVSEELSAETNLVFTEIFTGSRKIDVYPINHQTQDKIVKKVDESTIKVSVAELYFKKLGTQSYRYRLLGLDDNWVNLGKNRSFVLAGLSEGRYVLDVQSKVDSETWSKNNLRLEIIVEANFMESSTAFYLLAVISMLSFIIILFLVKRYYIQRLSKAENLVKIEEIRLKEVRKQNVDLKIELDKKVKEIHLLSTEVDESTRIVNHHQFRDSVSGFYRYQSIVRMLENADFGSKNSTFRFNLVFIFQLTDFSALEQQHGAISSAEIINYVGIELKKYCPANVHMCLLGNDSFIIFGNTLHNKNLTSILCNLRSKLINSKIPIANHMTVNTRVASTYLEMYPDKIHSLVDLITVSDLLIAIHKQYNSAGSNLLMRVDLNRSIDKLNLMNELPEVQQMVEKNFFTTHFL